MIKVGSCVQFKEWMLYKGETIPDLPEEEWTGEVISSWGAVHNYHKVRRHYDNRILPVMERDLILSNRIWEDKPIVKEPKIKKFNIASMDLDDPKLQTFNFN